ncbi:MAG: hypothetical protein Kow0098_17380 [Ignavibacteriaceae bacterium]
MQNKKIQAALLCGFGAAVLTTVPGLKSFGCCLIIPLAGAISVVLYLKMNREEILPIETKTVIILGLLTGIISAVFATSTEVLITFITKTNDFVESLPASQQMLRELNLGTLAEDSLKMMNAIAEDIRNKGFSFFYTFAVLTSNTIVNTIFSILGAVIGMIFINRRINAG